MKTLFAPALLRLLKGAVSGLMLCLAVTHIAAHAQGVTDTKNLAPGFEGLKRDSTLLVLPVDVELFSMSAGGALEPRADWTDAATKNMTVALQGLVKKSGVAFLPASEAVADEFAEQAHLHAAVAQSISLHHAIGGGWALPTKEGKLDWSFDDAMRGLGQKTGARYGLFVWVRDSYASAERKAAMVLMAIAGIGLTGGVQVGYASLVDLESGRVLWFNRLARGAGDLREADSATETVGALMSGFPVAK